MAAMPTVAAMHEDVHQRACQKQQVRQDAQQMRAMLLPQEESGDRYKGQQYKTAG
jgi:hypothetical protein